MRGLCWCRCGFNVYVDELALRDVSSPSEAFDVVQLGGNKALFSSERSYKLCSSSFISNTSRIPLLSPSTLAPAPLSEIAEAVSATTLEIEALVKSLPPPSDLKHLLGEFYENVEVRSAFESWLSSPPSAPLSDDVDANVEPEMDLDSILNGLIEMFKEKNNRDPTEAEVKIWIEQITSASAGV